MQLPVNVIQDLAAAVASVEPATKQSPETDPDSCPACGRG